MHIVAHPVSSASGLPAIALQPQLHGFIQIVQSASLAQGPASGTTRGLEGGVRGVPLDAVDAVAVIDVVGRDEPPAPSSFVHATTLSATTTTLIELFNCPPPPAMRAPRDER